MTSATMDVFSLRDSVIGEYRNFATSFTTIHDEDIRKQVEAIYAEGHFWPDPLLQINPSFEGGASLADLIADGALDPRTADIFRVDGVPRALYKHQAVAVAKAVVGESFVVTTGTGSGKSLCFFIPIVSAVLAERRRGADRRTRAIIVYPMNALANSQCEELERYLSQVDGERPVTFARYTGQETADERRAIAENPPDILLTNFMMLELLMTRQDELDQQVIGHCAGLRFLVLDELHTYRGRQGADVALLVRRVRERLSPERLQCIGTSATMASEGSLDDKRRVVARVASRLFAADIPESNVIVERLVRKTDPALDNALTPTTLGAAIDAGIAPTISDAELRTHPLAVWAERRLGIEWSDTDQRWVRAKPLTLGEAARELGRTAGRPEAQCRDALRTLLVRSSLTERDRNGHADASPRSFFAFKLHQFVSGAGHAYATLEPPGQRKVTVDGQQYLPGDAEKRLYATHFCRDCGQEYHPVRLVSQPDGRQEIRTRDIDDAPPPSDDDAPEAASSAANDPGTFGFLALHPRDADFTFRDHDDDYPEAWFELNAAGDSRMKSHYRPARVLSLDVAPDGTVGRGAKAWFIPGRFRFCLRCGATHTTAARDRTRLASLSAEGRSSATTVLVGSALRWMHGADSALPRHTRKLLGFTDNRQDAALQAGHFNDFHFVSLIRAGFLAALDAAGDAGLRSQQLGEAQQIALGFGRASPEFRAECLQDPGLKGINVQSAEATLRQVLSYRVWFDQRRGWRYTNPNLEQLRLVTVDYDGLDEFVADEEVFADAPDDLRLASPAERAEVYREIFDHLRKWMAIRSTVLEPTGIEQMIAGSHSFLRSPWGLTRDERVRPARWLFVTPPARKEVSLRDEDLLVRGGSRSALGKILRASVSSRGLPLWKNPARVRKLKPKDFDKLTEALLTAACTHGLVVEEATPFGDKKGFRLNDACIRFKRRSPDDDPAPSSANTFFRSYYTTLAATLRAAAHPLFGFEAREHTAQVDREKRAVREKRFRFGAHEEEELKRDEKNLREIGESGRFLPVLFCSPTMELGVDISALNAVYLRNVPPTPANYAQRGGRAGRSGQAALVLTYCAAQSPHDQYFFRDPKNMVHGEVRPPLLDLANRDLVESHLQAVWLACTAIPLDPSIAKLLVLGDAGRPLKDDVKEPMAQPRVAAEALRRIRRVLGDLEADLSPEAAPWYPGPDAFAAEVIGRALQRFDQAFHRWRDLFVSAEQQRDAARRTMDDYAAPYAEKRAAQGRHAQAMDQLTLLQQGTSAQSSDFYTYRYLATEGFLPGYNFPRLPLMAYIPANQDGRGRQTFLQRPRFLALSEFGPRSLVYHEGRAYRVARAMLALGQRGAVAADAQLPTSSVRICATCGAGHFEDQASLCHACGASLTAADIVNHVFRIENVATQPAERITANDEERQRQGFDLQTTFQWARRGHEVDVRDATATDAAGAVARLAYGPGATITRLNKGLRRRANKSVLGFKIDPASGYWAKNEDEDDDAPQDPTITPKQWIVPSVQDHKNALHLTPLDDGLNEESLATLQHALLRGIESVYQLEEGEVLAEPMPTREARKSFLYYEATEGGAGVLARLVADVDGLAKVARKALQVMHYDLPDEGSLPDDPSALADRKGTACVAACYRCVMSYYNQPEHELLDRRELGVRAVLLRLASACVVHTEAAPPSAPSRAPCGGEWRAEAAARGIPAVDAEPIVVGGVSLPLVWRRHYVVALEEPVAPETRAGLDDLGFEVIAFDDRAAWGRAFEQLARVLGGAA